MRRFDFRKLVTQTSPLAHAPHALGMPANRTEDAVESLLDMSR